MKKVEKVSIAEISFTLDSDAYLSLKQYLDSLRNYYDKDPDGAEIIADIEARVAELILEEQLYTRVVSKALIDTIIAQLGSPEEFDHEAGEGTETPRPTQAQETSIPRRLHRSDEGKIFGGVLVGIAKFWDISVAWVRLVFLFPLLISILSSPFHWHWLNEFAEGWFTVFFVTYIVLWIALPMARTPRQKLEARGEKITPSSIRQNLQGTVTSPSGKKAASVAAEILTVIGHVVLLFIKFVVAIVGFSLLFAALAIAAAMFATMFHPTAITVGITDGPGVLAAFAGMAVLSPVLFVMLSLFCAMMPLLVLGIALLSFTFSWRLGRMFYSVSLGLWGLSMIFLGIVAASNVNFFRHEFPSIIEQWDDRWDDHYDDDDDDRYRHGRQTNRVEIRTIVTSDSDESEAGRDSLQVFERDSVAIEEFDLVPESAEATSSKDENGRVKIRRIED
jgi:phage shock protein PspC (stress-responsive transcriptional regulator)